MHWSAGRASIVALLVGAIGFTGTSTASPRVSMFAEPVTLTEPGVGGFEPSVQVDRHGNVYVTAHKDRHVNAVAPDPSTPRSVRGASYLWTSSDSRTFRTLTPDHPYTEQPGIEGDLAMDDAGHLYFVDTYAGDVALTRWTVAGRGRQQVDLHHQMLGRTQPMEDRPWLAAKGNGTVLYTSNSGASPVHSGRSETGSGSGPGRFTVYMSYDGGRTFDQDGVTLRDSGWCHPAADRTPKSRLLYVVCIDVDQPAQAFDHAVFAYTSRDDGRTWSRTRFATWASAWWPTTAVAADGVVWTVIPDDGKARLFSSADQGRTWREYAVPMPPGVTDVSQTALAVSRTGDVAVLTIARGAKVGGTHVYAAVRSKGRWQLGRASTDATNVAAADEGSRGEFFQAAYGPDGRLHVVWAGNSTAVSKVFTGADLHDVYYAVTRS